MAITLQTAPPSTTSSSSARPSTVNVSDIRDKAAREAEISKRREYEKSMQTNYAYGTTPYNLVDGKKVYKAGATPDVITIASSNMKQFVGLQIKQPEIAQAPKLQLSLPTTESEKRAQQKRVLRGEEALSRPLRPELEQPSIFTKPELTRPTADYERKPMGSESVVPKQFQKQTLFPDSVRTVDYKRTPLGSESIVPSYVPEVNLISGTTTEPKSPILEQPQKIPQPSSAKEKIFEGGKKVLSMGLTAMSPTSFVFKPLVEKIYFAPPTAQIEKTAEMRQDLNKQMISIEEQKEAQLQEIEPLRTTEPKRVSFEKEAESINQDILSGKIAYEEGEQLIDNVQKKQEDYLTTINKQVEQNEAEQKSLEEARKDLELRYGTEETTGFLSGAVRSLSPEYNRRVDNINKRQEELNKSWEGLNKEIALSGFSDKYTIEQFIEDKKKSIDDSYNLERSFILAKQQNLPSQLENLYKGLEETRTGVSTGSKAKDAIYTALYPAGVLSYGTMKSISGASKYVVKPVGTFLEKTHIPLVSWAGKEIRAGGEFGERKPVTSAAVIGVSTLTAVPTGQLTYLTAVKYAPKLATNVFGRAAIAGLGFGEINLQALGLQKGSELLMQNLPSKYNIYYKGKEGYALNSQEFSSLYDAPDFDRALISKLQEKAKEQGWSQQDVMSEYQKEKYRQESKGISRVMAYTSISKGTEVMGRALTTDITAKQIAKVPWTRYWNPIKTWGQPITRRIALAGVTEGVAFRAVEQKSKDKKLSPLDLAIYGVAGGLSAGYLGGIIASRVPKTVAPSKMTKGGRGASKTVEFVANVIDEFEYATDKLADAVVGVTSKTGVRTTTPPIAEISTEQKLLNLYSSPTATYSERLSAKNIYEARTGKVLSAVPILSTQPSPPEMFSPFATTTEKTPVREITLTPEKAMTLVGTKEIIEVPKRQKSLEPTEFKRSLQTQAKIKDMVSIPVMAEVPVPVTESIRDITPAPRTPTIIETTTDTTTDTSTTIETTTNVPVTTFTRGFPFFMAGLAGDSRGFGFGKGMKQWTVTNPLLDLATPYFARKKYELPMLNNRIKPNMGGMAMLKPSQGAGIKRATRFSPLENVPQSSNKINQMLGRKSL